MFFAWVALTFLFLLLLDIAAVRWGANSRDTFHISDSTCRHEVWT